MINRYNAIDSTKIGRATGKKKIKSPVASLQFWLNLLIFIRFQNGGKWIKQENNQSESSFDSLIFFFSISCTAELLT